MRSLFAALVVSVTALLASCATANGGDRAALGEQSVRYGVVTDVAVVKIDGDHQLGVGTVLGAAAGGLIGHQIGGGAGRDVATVLGAIGGGLVGNALQNREFDRRAGQQFVVHLDNGASITVTQPAGAGVYVGDHVRVEGNGREARVVRS